MREYYPALAFEIQESIYMSYSDFDLKKVKSEFNLDIVETEDLFSIVEEVEISSFLSEIL